MEALVILLWYAIATGLGAMEACLYHRMDPDKFMPIDEHYVFTVVRVVCWIPVLWLYLLISGGQPFIEALLFAVASVGGFPFFHDGMYYLSRNLLDGRIYLDRWTDESNTTSAKFSFTYKVRLVMLLISACFLL